MTLIRFNCFGETKGRHFSSSLENYFALFDRHFHDSDKKGVMLHQQLCSFYAQSNDEVQNGSGIVNSASLNSILF